MAYTHLALIHLSATMPSSVGINTAAIPSELYTAPIAAPSNFSVTNMYEPSVVSQLPKAELQERQYFELQLKIHVVILTNVGLLCF